MEIALAGSGPAAEALRAALDDLDVGATVRSVAPAEFDDPSLGAVVAPAGAEAFDRARAARLVAVEVGGVGGRPVDGVDAAVSTFSPDSARFRDLRARVASTTDDSSDAPTGDRAAVRLAGAVAGRRAVALLAGDDVGGTIVEVSGTEVGAERSFLAVPTTGRDRSPRRERRDDDRDRALARAERALDERVGLLTEAGERDSFPAPYYIARTADTTAFSAARAGEFAAGVAADWDTAFMKALGEGLERYSAGCYRESEFEVAPEHALASPVGPARFVRPDDRPEPSPDESLAWLPATELATGASASVPASLVHYPPPDEPVRPAITTGLGLGGDGVGALLSGLYEVIERDAAMLSWYSTYDPLGLAVDTARSREHSPNAADAFETLAARARSQGLAVTPLLVTVDVDVPVVAVAVHRDGGWPAFAVGSAANLDAVAAARSALAEALQNWMELRSMGPEDASEEGGAIGEYAAFPPAAEAFVDADDTVPAAAVGPSPVPDGEAELEAVVERARVAGLTPYATRLTPDDVERLGFEAVRVLAPSAQPLFTGEPYFGERARTVPGDLGASPRLDRDYHPYP